MSQSITDQVAEIAEPILVSLGLELVDIEYRREGQGWVLRLFIDREGGVTLDDLVEVSRELGAVLEVEDTVKTAYNLEVSSPGINRPLKKEADFVRFAGSRVKIRTHELLDPDGSGELRKTFVGELLGFEQGRVLLRLESKAATEVALDPDGIDKANVEFKF